MAPIIEANGGFQHELSVTSTMRNARSLSKAVDSSTGPPVAGIADKADIRGALLRHDSRSVVQVVNYGASWLTADRPLSVWCRVEAATTSSLRSRQHLTGAHRRWPRKTSPYVSSKLFAPVLASRACSEEALEMHSIGNRSASLPTIRRPNFGAASSFRLGQT